MINDSDSITIAAAIYAFVIVVGVGVLVARLLPLLAIHYKKYKYAAVIYKFILSGGPSGLVSPIDVIYLYIAAGDFERAEKAARNKRYISGSEPGWSRGMTLILLAHKNDWSGVVREFDELSRETDWPANIMEKFAEAIQQHDIEMLDNVYLEDNGGKDFMNPPVELAKRYQVVTILMIVIILFSIYSLFDLMSRGN